MDNPIYMISEKMDQGSSSSTVVIDEKKSEQASFDYARMERPSSIQEKFQSAAQKHMWIFPYCALAAVLIACGTVCGLIAVKVELRQTQLMQTMLHQAPPISLQNQPDSPAPCNGSSNNSGPTVSAGIVYTRWGVDSCSATATLIYAGSAASGSNSLTTAQGGGSNYLCMTHEPEYRVGNMNQEDPRSRIFGAEYRNGHNFGHMTSLHGHDVPCATCLTTGGRHALMMIPGKASCPEDWTLEYYGYLMAARHNQARTSYICVDYEAESRPATAAEDQTSALLFPVETVCGTGGGLPCSPYQSGKELTCVVCTL